MYKIFEVDSKNQPIFNRVYFNRNIFQTSEMFELYKRTKYYEPIFLVVKNNKAEILGGLLAVIIKEGPGFRGYFTSRCIVMGGPVIKDNDIEVCRMLLERLNQIAKKKAIFIQFRNLFDLSPFNFLFQEMGYEFEEHLDIIIDLTKSAEELWKDIHSKRRNEIRRAERENTSCELIKHKDQFAVTYNILAEVYSRARLPLPKYDFFETVFDLLHPEIFKVFVALNKGKVIGTMYTLCYGDTIYDWYAGSYMKYYNKYPNDLIPWKVFLWGKENGYKKFDFGGAGKPGVPYGVRDYKKKFGGQFVNYGRYNLIMKKKLYIIGKLGIMVRKNVHFKRGRAGLL